jgi:SAM-dependent methyltransferase
MADSSPPSGVTPERRGREFFENLWRQGDPWRLETSPFEEEKYRAQLGLLDGPAPRRVLEIGCGAGVFTAMLAARAEQVLAVDISPSAIERAKARHGELRGVTFQAADVVTWDLPEPGSWDLIVLSETIYYVGWLYPFFDVYWLACRILEATRRGGRFLMANTCGGVEDYLLRTGLIRTYRDLFVNVGFELAREVLHTGDKDGARIEALLSLYRKPPTG